MKKKKEMKKDFLISTHFIQRFNERYLNQNQHWTKDDLKDYLNCIMTSGQIRKLNKYTNNSIKDEVKIGMGARHNMVMVNNKLITLKYKPNHRENMFGMV
tara:strand:- start:415 stop:714 length:300 start_codon:yes stop_codon:yes gene_type:complete